MHKNATKCNETIGKWCKNKHGASKIMDTSETYHYVIFPFEGPLLIQQPHEVHYAEFDHDDSMCWLARTPHGSILLMIYTRGVTSAHIDVFPLHPGHTVADNIV
jgi:hypothetical protein